MGSWETNWNWDVLERIVVLLFALADLADLAAGAPFLRRRQALGILRHGEAEASAFLIGNPTDSTALTDGPAEAGDATCLAARLRMLALLLCALLAHAVGRFALLGAAGPRACRPLRRISGPAVRRPGAPPALDTS